MRCVDCELHDCVVGTHFCNYKGISGRRKPRRVSEEDAYKDVPCEYVEDVNEPTFIEIWEVSGNPNGNRLGIAYTKSRCPTLDHLIAFRNSMAEMHECKLEYLIRTDVIKHTERNE